MIFRPRSHNSSALEFIAKVSRFRSRSQDFPAEAAVLVSRFFKQLLKQQHCLQEWKRLARIMDRLFFWMTLTALISISVVLSCLLMWQD